MEYQSISLSEKLANFSEHWKPKIISSFNDYRIKLVKIKGEFVWHHHAETDELFLVLEGNLEIHLRDGKVSLKAGEMFVVSKGVEHKPVAAEECQLMLIEPAGTVNTGNVKDAAMTAEEDVWI